MFSPNLGYQLGLSGAASTSTVGVATLIIAPNGARTNFHYVTEIASFDGQPYSRLEAVSNSYGYMLRFSYFTNGFSSAADVAPFRRLARVTGINMLIDACPPSGECDYSEAWPEVNFVVTPGINGAPDQIASARDTLGRTTNYT